jgi:hypothetical protein
MLIMYCSACNAKHVKLSMDEFPPFNGSASFKAKPPARTFLSLINRSYLAIEGVRTGYVSALISRRGNCCFTTSMGGRGDEYLDGFSKYLKDEHTAKGYPGVFDKEEWKLVPTTTGTPQQQNG